MRRASAQLVIFRVIQRRGVLPLIRHRVEQIIAADTAAVLSVHIAHEQTPSVFGADSIHAGPGRTAVLQSGRNREALDEAGVLPVIVLAVHHRRLAARIHHNVIAGAVVGIFDIGIAAVAVFIGFGGSGGLGGGCGRSGCFAGGGGSNR